MTSHELARELLRGPDLPVHQSYNYGDHWRTQVAPEIKTVEEGRVEHSAYHSMDKVVDEEKYLDLDDPKDEDGDAVECKQREVIILS